MAEDDFLTDENVLLFVTESREMLEEVEPHLVELGQSAADVGEVDGEVINLIFRLFHSLKGSAGFFQFDSVVKVTHEAETLLDLFRSGQARMENRHTDVLFRACDVVSLLLNQIESAGSDSGIEAQVHEVTAELTETIRREKGGVPAPETTPEPKEAAPPKAAQDTGPEAAPPEEVQAPGPDAFELVITPDMVEHFIQEADEQLEQVEGALLELEKTPGDEEQIGEAFRLLHSFKGNCGFMGYADIEKLSHKAETVLSAVKDGLLAADSSNIPVLLHVVDVLRGAVADLSEGGSGEVENSALFLDLLDDMLPASEKEKPKQEAAPPAPAEEAPAQPEAARAEPVRPPILQPEAAQLLRKDTPPDEKKLAAGSPAKPRAVARQDIRVDLERLDQLINLVGELVIAEVMVTRNPDLAEMELDNFERAATHLDKIVRDLQDMALSVRMIPILGVFRKMIRLVHDLSAKAQKKVNLTLLGEETELDKTVTELIADPLVHIVRNALDHGLESPEERKAAGKNETGELTIEAKHEGGEVWIVISEDGQGLDREKLLAKAIEKGLVQGDGGEMSDQEVYELIFQPGFSTALEVTDISGRGVGMDVVKKNIEKIKGRVDIQSEPDRGTTFTLRIPLTLAIMEGMLVRVGRFQYTIPLLAIRESIQVESERVTTTMHGEELVKVREEIIPVVRLHQLQGIQSEHKKLDEGLLVIVEHQGESVGLFVDEILGEHQAVIKGLSNYVGHVAGVSGCTILGDGEVSLILDVGGLIKRAKEGAAGTAGRRADSGESPPNNKN